MNHLYIWPKKSFIGKLFLEKYSDTLFTGFTELPSHMVSSTNLIDYFIDEEKLKLFLYLEKVIFRIYGIGERIFSLVTGSESMYNRIRQYRIIKLTTTQWYSWDVEILTSYPKYIGLITRYLYSYSKVFSYRRFPGVISPNYKFLTRYDICLCNTHSPISYYPEKFREIVNSKSRLVLLGLNPCGYIKSKIPSDAAKVVSRNIAYKLLGYRGVRLPYNKYIDYKQVIHEILSVLQKYNIAAREIIFPVINLKNNSLHVVYIHDGKYEFLSYYDGIYINTSEGKVFINIMLTDLKVYYRIRDLIFELGINISYSDFTPSNMRIKVYKGSSLVIDSGSEINKLLFKKLGKYVKRLLEYV